MIRKLLIILCIAVAASILIPRGDDGSGDDTGDAHRSPPKIRVSFVKDLGPVASDPAVRLRDCGYSANFQGKSIWIFGDTFLSADNAESQRLLCNSWSSTYDINARDGIVGFSRQVDEAGAPVAFFPMTTEEIEFNALHKGKHCTEEPCGARWAIWPGTIVADPARGWAYIFYHKIYSEPGLLNFHHVGHSIAVWKNFEAQPERPLFNFSDKYPSLFFTEGKEGFGSAAFLQADTLYVYGCEMDKASLTKPCRVARVPIASILDKSAWRFYSRGGSWSPNLGESQMIFDGNEMMSVFYNPYVTAYIAVYSKPMSNQVMLRTASAPEGPWSSPLEVFTAKDSATELGWVYDALAHPELSQDNGRTVYVTYSRHTARHDSEMRLVTIELAPAQ